VKYLVFNEDIFSYSILKYGFLSKSDDAPVSPISPPILTVISSFTPSIPIFDHITLPTSPLHNHTSSPVVTTTDSFVSLSNQNIHPMTTWAKSNISKPKIYIASLVFVPSELVNFKTDLQSPQWNQVMQDEYRALINNRTWTLIPLPLGVNIVDCK